MIDKPVRMGCGWPQETRFSPTHVTMPNMVILCQTIPV